jgi:nitrite reductase/ring-hydroxylating ferredoxin subunit
MSSRLLCRLSELPEGDARGFDPLGTGQDSVLVIRHGRRLHVYRDACPHQGTTPMAWRKNAYLNAERDRIVCSAHGAQFDIDTGACTLGPCLGQSLTALPWTLNDDDEIYLTLDPNLEIRS